MYTCWNISRTKHVCLLVQLKSKRKLSWNPSRSRVFSGLLSMCQGRSRDILHFPSDLTFFQHCLVGSRASVFGCFCKPVKLLVVCTGTNVGLLNGFCLASRATHSVVGESFGRPGEFPSRQWVGHSLGSSSKGTGCFSIWASVSCNSWCTTNLVGLPSLLSIHVHCLQS